MNGPYIIPYVSVIIPVFNEEGVIEAHVTQVAEYLYRLLGPERIFEILVVDDGSWDTTAAILANMERDRPYLKVVRHMRNFGRGRALRNGFGEASGRFVFTLDADLSYTPDHIEAMLAPLEKAEADIVLASAYHHQGHVEDVPFSRALTSRLGNMLLSFSFDEPIKTLTCVVRGYTAEVIKSMVLFSDDKDIHLEILQKASILGYVIKEIPATLKWRATKRSSARKKLASSQFFKIVGRHLFFNFLYRPSLLLWWPLLFLGGVIILLMSTIVINFIQLWEVAPATPFFIKFLGVLREQILAAQITYLSLGLAFVLFFQLVSMVFVAKQNNFYYQDTTAFLTHLNRRLTRLEKDDS